jgi:uncharacterized RDD family membrane protein YckC
MELKNTIMENQDLEKIKYEAAKAHVAAIKKFAINLLVFCILFLVFYGSDMLNFDGFNFNFGKISIVFWIWGIILAVRAVKLFVLDYDWERKNIEKYMKNEK